MEKKYIIEIEDENFHQYSDSKPSEYLWRVKGFNSLVFDEVGLRKLTPYTEPDLERIRKEAYEAGMNSNAVKMADDKAHEAYQKGLEDAWEAARKIANMPYGEEEKAFGSGGWAFIEKHTAAEAIEKIRQYEQKQEEIQVGDEVRNIKGGWTAVVSKIDEECMTLMGTNGALSDGYDVNWFTKTGRHFPEIAEVLQKMREES